ncbi:MAG: hypothetical protein IPL27_22930 [Lewinellaceae bacterium]|nr:hypothetical protein [Lewinellaceae bacterium]
MITVPASHHQIRIVSSTKFTRLCVEKISPAELGVGTAFAALLCWATAVRFRIESEVGKGATFWLTYLLRRKPQASKQTGRLTIRPDR